MVQEMLIKDNAVDSVVTRIDMSQYPNILTPPSSNEDSPQPAVYYHSDNMSPSPSALSTVYMSPELAYSSPAQPLPLNFDINLKKSGPYLKILEQPIDRFRFRYKSEMTGTHGSLCGHKSDKSRKLTYPTVELCNFTQPAVLRCSIYQYNAQADNMPHAHRLVKKQGKDEVDDPHDVVVSHETGYVHSFHSMGIIHTAKKNIVTELVRKKTKLKKEEIARSEGATRKLTTKEEVEIKGLAEQESKSINLNVVVLRFDAFYVCNDIYHPICEPVFTHGINNLKSALTGELKIVRMDHISSPAKGGQEIFILVERVTKKNIKIHFYELDDDENVIWDGYGKFSDLDVHHQYAIVFKTPPYRDENISSPVNVFIELERPSDSARSEAKQFRYTPNKTFKTGNKRMRPTDDSSSYDTSFSSGDMQLPLTISNLPMVDARPLRATNFPDNLLDEVDLQVNSAELQKALTNIDSEEFKTIFKEFGPSFCAPSLSSIEIDAPNGHGTGPLPAKGNIRNQLPQCLMGNRNFSRTRSKNNAKPVTTHEERLAQTTIQELQEFILTKPDDVKVIAMLQHYFGTKNKTNALHVLIEQDDSRSILFLLKLFFIWKQTHLINVKNINGETPLHIATYCNNLEMIVKLVDCGADLSAGDSDGNTPLHIAVMNMASVEILDKLLCKSDLSRYIEIENNDGSTPLNLAIEADNLRAVKMVCMRNANINRKHKKSGFTPLRFAIEKKCIDIVKYLLSLPNVDPLVEDFQGKTPFFAASKIENEELLGVITEFMRDHGYCEVQIKNEPEDSSDEEMEEEKFGGVVKMEQISPEELRDMYNGIKSFTPECLDVISEILDGTRTWENLSELLDIGHLMRTGLYEQEVSPTKRLLKLAVESGESVWQIREFLGHLDENHAVDVIDNMVKNQFM